MSKRVFRGALWVHVDTQRIARGEPPIAINRGNETLAFVSECDLGSDAVLRSDPRAKGTAVRVWIETSEVREL